jgi:hypothetical protein
MAALALVRKTKRHKKGRLDRFLSPESFVEELPRWEGRIDSCTGNDRK